MRTLLLLICFMFTTACTQQTNFDSEELSLIEKEASELLSKYPEPNFDFEYSAQNNIAKLKPESVHVTKNGLYIVLNSGFSSESGIYVPREGIAVNTDDGQDPKKDDGQT
ncbi:hypothetical protein L3V43_22090 [Pseudoalteromonas sp. L23]|uniref:hypothetical protein n=1 Tax=unclassified Pseudoalteromonas TaxID=194690 RepID=UPI001EF0563A|nr:MULTISPECIES: hypothetical protein [unclassified Pseudoalteromonas]MCF7516562.1 hypothetical protein [Pseudoalteromonas sp. L7]MCF7528345.1 hypothetical protein [Pseudoalteromonas sp. L23]MCX2769749.1 hypothetical protein [Pseudoalteromonas sp. B530]